jgi:hypothetical protein
MRENDLMIVDGVLLGLIQRSDERELLVELLVLRNRPRDCRVMLLVTLNHMANEWALGREKSA